MLIVVVKENKLNGSCQSQKNKIKKLFLIYFLIEKRYRSVNELLTKTAFFLTKMR